MLGRWTPLVSMIRKLTPQLLLIVVGVTGAVGQAVLLFYNLTNRYPYKVMSNPSDRFYEGIAYVGLVLAPLAATFVGVILRRRFPYSFAAVTCLSCPLIFLLVFAWHIRFRASTWATLQTLITRPRQRFSRTSPSERSS